MDDPIAPPVEQGPLVDEIARTRWPGVIGVISIVYAAIGLACGSAMTAWAALGPLLPEMWRGGVTVPLAMRLIMIALIVPVLGLGLVLLTGGISLIRRKRSSVALLRRWALLRLIMVVIGVTANIILAPANLEMNRQAFEYQSRILQEMSQPVPQQPSEEQQWVTYIVSQGVGAAVVAIYPLFLGFYLSRKKINDEVAEWR